MSPSLSDGEYRKLQTEWLRHRPELFDSLTGLPSLPAIVEDVRRMVEAHGSADVIYLDLGRSGGQEPRLGWAAYDQTVGDFAGLLTGLAGIPELGSASLLCVHTVKSDRFVVFCAGDLPESSESGLSSAALRKHRLLLAIFSWIEATPPGSRLRDVELTAGHGRVQLDPRVRSERAVQQAVSDAMALSLREREGCDVGRRAELSRLIADGDVRTVFHPIVRLVDRCVIGHEALTRPLGDVSFGSVEDLFAFAESTELLMDFELLCCTKAIRAAGTLQAPGILFLNASAPVIEDARWSSGVIEEVLGQRGLDPKAVVVEITERVAIDRPESFKRALATFKASGFRVAVDDVGAGHASLQALARIEPDFVKFDVSLVRDVHRNPVKQGLIESLRVLADKINASVIAEGVEQEEELTTLLTLGIGLGQGFHFHREQAEA